MKLKVKTPKSIIGWIILLSIILLFFSLFFYEGITDVFFFVRMAILTWIALILMALIGAIFIGMFLSHRILSIAGFTPFEEEMLKMREEIKAIHKKLDSLMAQDNPGENPKKKGDED
jgi:predicted membrane protein